MVGAHKKAGSVGLGPHSLSGSLAAIRRHTARRLHVILLLPAALFADKNLAVGIEIKFCCSKQLEKQLSSAELAERKGRWFDKDTHELPRRFGDLAPKIRRPRTLTQRESVVPVPLCVPKTSSGDDVDAARFKPFFHGA
jgi:hypothetical protein